MLLFSSEVVVLFSVKNGKFLPFIKTSSSSRKGKTSEMKLLHLFKFCLFCLLFLGLVLGFFAIVVCRAYYYNCKLFFSFWLGKKGKYIPEEYLINLYCITKENIFIGPEITQET